MKPNYSKVSRKAFFNQLALFLSIPFVYLAFKTVLRQKSITGVKEIRLPIELGKDIIFHGDIIYIKQNNEVRFYSSKCTHLGCKINTLKGHYMACGCHGSYFSLDGKVINGPATTKLKSLEYGIDSETQEYIVKLG